MIIWFCMIIPVVTIIYLHIYHPHKVVLWEHAVMLGVPMLTIVLCKYGVETTQTRDTEYWGGWITSAEYYEDWNEYIEKECTKEVGSGEDKKTVTYDCSYVDYHSEYWQTTDSNGQVISVDESKYLELKGTLGKPVEFVDLHRDYHTNDGDKYMVEWNGEKGSSFVPATTVHSYENRVQASDSVFNFQTIENPQELGLYEYPEISEYFTVMPVMWQGGLISQASQRRFQMVNTQMGRRKQVYVWVCIFKDQPLQRGFDQQSYWKNGNKNEFVITIGVDKQNNVQWSHVFSWTEVEGLKIEARNFIMEQKDKPLDLVKIGDWLEPQLDKRFIRKSFSDFSYLTVEPSIGSILLSFFVTLLVDIGLAIWVVKNDTYESFRR